MTFLRLPSRFPGQTRRPRRSPEAVRAEQAQRAEAAKTAKQKAQLREQLLGYSLTGDRISVTLAPLRFLRELPRNWP